MRPRGSPTRIIPLNHGKVAIVDGRDYPLVSQYRWSAHKSRRKWYAQASHYENGRRRCIEMHRLILGFPKDLVDHRNHDGLDNRRRNIRTCTVQQNNMNKRPALTSKSGLKGVYFDLQYSRWRATIQLEGVGFALGSFGNKIDAARAYDQAARQLFGKFAYVNGV